MNPIKAIATPDSDFAPLRGAELAATVGLLLLSAGGFLQIIQGDADSNIARTGNWITNTIWVSSYIFVIFALLRRTRLRTVAVRHCWPLLLLLAFTCLSILWSEDRYLTFLRDAALVGTTALGLYLGERLSLQSQIRLLVRVLGIAAVFSLLFGLFLPRLGIGDGDLTGDWFGIFPHKNLLGLNMALGFGLFSLLFWSNRRKYILYLPGAALCLLLVWLSRSATAAVCCAGAAAVLVLVRPVLRAWRRLTRARRLALIALTIVLTVVAVDQYDRSLDLLDRDAGLTGRTQMWALVAVMISQKPWLGYGYGAFWRGYSSPAGELWDALGMEFFYSHNGFLDVWLDVGAIGLVLVILAYVIAFRRSLIFATKDASMSAIWPLFFLVFLLLSNLTEGSILHTNSLPSILFTAIYYRLGLRTDQNPQLSGIVA